MRGAGIAASLSSLFLFAPSAAFAQSDDSSLRFEAVTIKYSYSGNEGFDPFLLGRASRWDGQCTGGPGTPNPGFLKCNNVSFAQLVAHAYHLGPLQFVAERWMESALFKVEAKVPAEATQEQLPAMARNLLAERFKLAVHFIKAEMVGYEMTVAKGGPKFKAATLKPKPGRGGQNWGGEPWNMESLGLGRAGIQGGQPSMDQLASFLSCFMDWPVVDKTGLIGRYDITLQFGAATPWLVGPALSAPQGPPPVEAVRDQLGLVLERTKSVVDVLVVDHAERAPTKN
jgi:uncharacterized protein (TIGR03435 family)